jgi:hypothetical protein
MSTSSSLTTASDVDDKLLSEVLETIAEERNDGVYINGLNVSTSHCAESITEYSLELDFYASLDAESKAKIAALVSE